MALRISLALLLITCASLAFSETPSAELDQTEMERLTNKELIVHSKEISKCPWPEITVFTIIDVPPVDAAALFSNYQEQKEYIPDLIKSEPAKRIAENEVIVDFEMNLPWPLSTSKYSTGNVFQKLDGNEYEISWYLVESDSLIDSKGTVRFIPYGEKTLLKYQSLIHPDSKLAFLFCSRAKSGITKTVQAIVSYLEGTKNRDPEKIQRLINALPQQIGKKQLPLRTAGRRP